jgi:iduronate 2-sulfatase
MNRFLLAALALAVLQAVASAAPAKINVLHIVADDLNNDLGCYGDAIVKSPNIDKLAARGVRFDRAYCNYPVCNPSRTSFLSGKRPDTTGVVDNYTPTRTHLPDTVMLPQLFRQQGWISQKVGKLYHTGPEFEDAPSWDFDMRETNEAKKPPKEQIVQVSKGGAIVLNAADADTWDGKVARKAVELLETAVRDGKPFYIAAGFRRPHTPYISPQKYFDLYAPEKMPPLAEPAAHLAGIPPIALTYPVGHPALPEGKRPDVMCAYYASISFMDAQVGVLLEAMDRLKLWDNTVVVFQSDHGYHLGEHGGLWHKLTLFEQCTRVPLIIATPGRKPAVSPRLVELVDLYPTLAELCGLKPPADLEGESFVPLLNDPQCPWKGAVFTVVARSKDGKNAENPHLDASYMGRSVRTDQWRYTTWPDGRAELYNLSRDPHEYVNLADDAASAEILAKMKKLLTDGPKRVVVPAK